MKNDESSPAPGASPNERVLPLGGGRNFRDLGGYPTVDGRTVKWGRVYRSGGMARLTDADYRYLSTLGIRVVCDLRSSPERREEPTQWRATPDVDYRSWDYDDDEDDGGTGLAALLSEQDMTPDKVVDAMLETYRDFLVKHRDKYRHIFLCLADGGTPLVFNCSAGKDRTGVAAALILLALGVHRDLVVEDYALSDKVVDYEAELLTANLSDKARKDDLYRWIANVPMALVRPMLRSDPGYLENTLAYLEETSGGVMAYIRSDLGIDSTTLTRVREVLLD